MNEKYIKGKEYFIKLEYDSQSLNIACGSFGEISILKSPLFELGVKDLQSGICKQIKSSDIWKNITVNEYDGALCITFEAAEDFAIEVKADYDPDGISWYTDVINQNQDLSVMDITYPTPLMTYEDFNLFVPDGCGIVVRDAKNKSYN